MSSPPTSRRRARLALLGSAALVAPVLPVGLAAASPAAAASTEATVRTDRAVYATNGGVADVRVTLTTKTGRPLRHDVTVRYATKRGTARAGSDYLATAGTVTFRAGTRSGATAAVPVTTMRRGRVGTAKAVPLTLTAARGATVATPRVTVVVNAHGLPYQNASLPIATRVTDLLKRMTLVEKVGQMTQAERGSVTGDPTQISRYYLGSLLSGGGSTPTPNTPEAWADMVDAFQAQALTTRLQIPLVYGIDSVHGDNNLVGATIFPHNIGMGATRDPALVREEEHITAIETRATGPQWVFAPCLCVARDDRWGRTYESYGEDPNLVIAMETGIDGFQGRDLTKLAQRDHVLATAKHYAGDGDTEYGTSTTNGYKLDQGIVITNRQHFDRIDLAPYVPAVRQHHVGTVMPSYSSVDWVGDGLGNPIKMSANRQLLTDVLKRQIGFNGFLISDWEATHQVPGDWATQVRTVANAGMDMFMEPYAYLGFEYTLINEVRSGRVPMSRINDAVRRILTKKFQLGLFEHPYTDRTNIGTIGSPAHRAVARRAAAESQVLLKNAGHALPLKGTEKVYVAGSNANDLGNQAGGWTVTWQGQSGNTAFPGTTILKGIRQDDPNVTYSQDASVPMTGQDVGIVVVGETPYAEGFGDVGGPTWSDNGVPRPTKSMDLSTADRATIDKVCGAIPTCVVLVVAGRPQIVTDKLGKIDALVASWLPGSEGEGVADVLFGKRPFTGKLPVSWPRTAWQEPLNVGQQNYSPLFPFGYGITTG